MAWLLAEDEALKQRLAGITVADPANANRAVDVWYRWPQKEIREVAWPFITINLTDIMRAPLREQYPVIDPSHGYDIPGYTPDGNADTVARAGGPVPVDLLYMVTTYSRDPRHDRQLLSVLTSTDYIPFRNGWLAVEDNGGAANAPGVTDRYMELVTMQKSDTRDQDGAVVYRNAFYVKISSEILAATASEIQKVLERVITVDPDPSSTPDGSDMRVVSASDMENETITVQSS